MDAVDYQRFTDELVAWAVSEPAVSALIAVGSTAAVTHDPDQWSDHDVFVVAAAEAAARLLEDPSWLPDPERIVLWHTETVDGRAAVYEDGHLVELAVFCGPDIPAISVNDYRVLVGRERHAARQSRPLPQDRAWSPRHRPPPQRGADRSIARARRHDAVAGRGVPGRPAPGLLAESLAAVRSVAARLSRRGPTTSSSAMPWCRC